MLGCSSRESPTWSWHAAAAARGKFSRHQHPQHDLAALARLAEA
jgi:hypothetical protein